MALSTPLYAQVDTEDIHSVLCFMTTTFIGAFAEIAHTGIITLPRAFPGEIRGG
jgi:hypothetical protein